MAGWDGAKKSGEKTAIAAVWLASRESFVWSYLGNNSFCRDHRISFCLMWEKAIEERTGACLVFLQVHPNALLFMKQEALGCLEVM